MQFERKHIYIAAGVAGTIALVSLTFCLVLTSSPSKSVKFERCDNTSATVEDFKLTNCDENNHCKFERGKDVKVTLMFSADKPFDFAIAQLDFIDYSYSHSACHNGVSCPSEAGQRQSYEALIHIPEPLPPLKQHNVKLYMYNHVLREHFVCLTFPVEIV